MWPKRGPTWPFVSVHPTPPRAMGKACRRGQWHRDMTGHTPGGIRGRAAAGGYRHCPAENSRHATQLAMDALTPLLRLHAPGTSALGLCSPRPHIHRHWAHPRPHLHRDWAQARPYLNRDRAYPRPHPHRDWAHRAHVCAGTGLAFATSAQGLGSLLPHGARRRNNMCTSLWLSATFVI